MPGAQKLNPIGYSSQSSPSASSSSSSTTSSSPSAASAFSSASSSSSPSSSSSDSSSSGSRDASRRLLAQPSQTHGSPTSISSRSLSSILISISHSGQVTINSPPTSDRDYK
ncbi:MAG: hypothetical protein EXQ49_01050 [Acidobacteria bacterium]|nr:hypothetical protein [Acidobacteriota bacterium]